MPAFRLRWRHGVLKKWTAGSVIRLQALYLRLNIFHTYDFTDSSIWASGVTHGLRKSMQLSRLPKLIEDMWETMYASNGVGLAAPQVNTHPAVCDGQRADLCE
jgi:hypothetical protein